MLSAFYDLFIDDDASSVSPSVIVPDANPHAPQPITTETPTLRLASSQLPPPRHPNFDDNMTAFADGALSIHEALSNGDILAGARLWAALTELVNATSSSSTTTRNGSGQNSSRRRRGGGYDSTRIIESDDDGDGVDNDAPSLLLDPRKEMLIDLATRVAAAAVARLRKLDGDIVSGMASPDDARVIWLAAARTAPTIEEPSSIFAGIVRAHFARFTLEKTQKITKNIIYTKKNDAVVHPLLSLHFSIISRVLPPRAAAHFLTSQANIRAAAAIAAAMALEEAVTIVDDDDEVNNIISSSDLPLTQPPLVTAASGIRDARNRSAAAATATAAAAIPTPGPASTALSVLTLVLGEAAAWSTGLMSQDAPHSARFAVALALRSAAANAALECINAYREAAALDATLQMASILVDSASIQPRNGGGGGGGGGGGVVNNNTATTSAGIIQSNGEWAAAAMIAVNTWATKSLEAVTGGGRDDDVDDKVSEREGERVKFKEFELNGGGGGGVDDGLRPILRIIFTTPKGVTCTPPPQYSLFPPLVLSLPAAMAVCDEACDQAAYACALIERYEVLSRRSVGVGMTVLEATDVECAALERAMQRLQSDYVAVEHAFLLNALREATRDPPPLRARALAIKLSDGEGSGGGGGGVAEKLGVQ